MNAHWSDGTLPGVLAANAARMDGRPFLTLVDADGAETAFSYGDLLDLAAGWADRYRAHGLVPGDRVVVVLRHGIDLYAAYAGALLAGLVPAMFAHPSPKFSEDAYFATVHDLLAGSAAKALVVYPELAPKLGALVHSLPGFETLLVPQASPVPGRHRPVPFVHDPDSPAFLQYSSGTTGLKKGVVITHRALLWQVNAYADTIGAGEDDCIVSWLPLYHDMGLIACFFLPLVRRVRLVALSPFDWVRRPAMWNAAVARHRATLSWLPNFAYSFMAGAVPPGSGDLSSLRGVVNCSEPLLAASHDAFTARFAADGFRPEALAGSYAMAEATFAVTSGGFGVPLRTECVDTAALARSHVARPLAQGRRLVSSGVALPDTTIRILDEAGTPLPERHVGEIEIALPSLFHGYDNNPRASAEALVDGRYRTGDLGYLAEGHLFVTGRKRDLVIVGGKNIYPHDIEAIACNVDGVVPGRAVALGLVDESAGTEQLVVLAESERPVADWPALALAIGAAIAARSEVAAHDVRIVAPRTLRKSTSGKLARGANLELYRDLAAPAHAPAPVAPAVSAGPSLREQVRRLVIDDVLRGRPCDDDASLIRAGRIDSFAIVNLILGLETRFGVRIPERVAGDPAALDSIAAIAVTVARLREGGDDAAATPELTRDAIPMVTDTPVALSSKRAGFWTWYYRFTFRRLGIRYGEGLRVLGPLLLRPDGDPRNIVLGRGVTLMPWVDLKVRENGRIVLGDGCAIDTTARLVAANDAEIRLGDRAQVAFASIINAGADVIIGRDSATAGHCTIIASEHRYDSREPIMRQGYRHAPVLIGADVWLASGVLVSAGARIGNGAVIAAHSTVSGAIPDYAVAAGNPARVIRSRLR